VSKKHRPEQVPDFHPEAAFVARGKNLTWSFGLRKKFW
jgi:hypothetical protein